MHLHSCRDGLSDIDDAVLYIARRVLHIAPSSPVSIVSLGLITLSHQIGT